MTSAELIDRFAKRAPVALMARGLIDYCLSGPFLNPLAERLGRSTYTRQIEFAHLVALMADVVFATHPSVRAAYRNNDTLQSAAGLKCFYEKLQRVEPGVCAGLVRAVADHLRPLLAGRLTPEPVPGLRLLTLDGNKLAPTQRRLKVTRDVPVPLPGQALVLREHATGLFCRILPHTDAYDNERAFVRATFEWFGPGDCVVADSNFCTHGFITGLAGRGAHSVVRHHGSVGLHLAAEGDGREPQPEREVGRCPTGVVYESVVTYAKTDLRLRCVRVRLDKPTRHGQTDVRVLTTLSAEQACAAAVAELYLGRWTIERAFQELEAALRSEVDTLAHPKAALMGFCVAAAVYGMLEVARRHAPAGEVPLSAVLLGHELRTYLSGLSVAVEDIKGMPRADWSAERMLRWLEQVAARIDPKKYARSTRGPKKPRRRPRERKDHHEATQRLIEKPRKRRTPP